MFSPNESIIITSEGGSGGSDIDYIYNDNTNKPSNSSGSRSLLRGNHKHSALTSLQSPLRLVNHSRSRSLASIIRPRAHSDTSPSNTAFDTGPCGGTFGTHNSSDSPLHSESRSQQRHPKHHRVSSFSSSLSQVFRSSPSTTPASKNKISNGINIRHGTRSKSADQTENSLEPQIAPRDWVDTATSTTNTAILSQSPPLLVKTAAGGQLGAASETSPDIPGMTKESKRKWLRASHDRSINNDASLGVFAEANADADAGNSNGNLAFFRSESTLPTTNVSKNKDTNVDDCKAVGKNKKNNDGTNHNSITNKKPTLDETEKGDVLPLPPRLHARSDTCVSFDGDAVLSFLKKKSQDFEGVGQYNVKGRDLPPPPMNLPPLSPKTKMTDANITSSSMIKQQRGGNLVADNSIMSDSAERGELYVSPVEWNDSTRTPEMTGYLDSKGHMYGSEASVLSVDNLPSNTQLDEDGDDNSSTFDNDGKEVQHQQQQLQYTDGRIGKDDYFIRSINISNNENKDIAKTYDNSKHLRRISSAAAVQQGPAFNERLDAKKSLSSSFINSDLLPSQISTANRKNTPSDSTFKNGCFCCCCISFLPTSCYEYCNSQHKPSWSRISSAIVRNAPCFCCVTPLEQSATDRMVLTRLNVLCAFFALCQVAVGVFIGIITLSNDVVDRQLGLDSADYYRQALTPNLWTLSGSLVMLSMVGFVLFLTMIFTLPVIRRVNLSGAIRYMWVLLWLLPLEIYFVISLFDYHNVTEVWVKHWWSSPSMAWFRWVFCIDETHNEKCAVPIKGGRNYTTEEEWCEAKYNATDCSQIRDDATMLMSTYSYVFFYANAVIGLLLVALLILALSMLEGIISAPIVQSSKESNVPLWLTLPSIFCTAAGLLMFYSPDSIFSTEGDSSINSIHWIGVCYIVSGAMFIASALLGWFISAKTVLNTRDKTQKQLAVLAYIAMMTLTFFAVGSIFTASLIFSVDLIQVGLDDNSRGAIACFVDTVDSCSNCFNVTDAFDPELSQCPEWTGEDVLRIIQTTLKQSASLAAICLIYALSALRFGFALKSIVSRYEIDYV